MIKCNLAVLMAERKLSIQDIADKTGLSRTTISALVNENGKGIQFETMDALCELLKVTPGDLFYYSMAKCKVEVNIHSRTDEKVTEIDQNGKTVESEITLFADINLEVRSHISSIITKIDGIISLSFDHTVNVISVGLDISSPELRDFLKKHKYSDVSYIKDVITREVLNSISDFEELNRNGFHLLDLPEFIEI